MIKRSHPYSDHESSTEKVLRLGKQLRWEESMMVEDTGFGILGSFFGVEFMRFYG